MSTLAIVAIGVIALMLIPAIILVKPTTSRDGLSGSVGGVSSKPRSSATVPSKSASHASHEALRLGLPKQQSVEAPVDSDRSRNTRHTSSTGSWERRRRFMLTPQPENPRRYVPHCDGFADVPLSFTDGDGSHYTTRWRLCIN